jgi:hypothetical protein
MSISSTHETRVLPLESGSPCAPLTANPDDVLTVTFLTEVMALSTADPGLAIAMDRASATKKTIDFFIWSP